MERFDVAVSQLRALPVLPPTCERRRIALPWSRRGIIAGQTSPEVPHRGAAGRAQHRGVSTGIDSRDFKLEDVIKSVMNQVQKHCKGIILMHDFKQHSAKAIQSGQLQGDTHGAEGAVTTVRRYDEELTHEGKLSFNTRPESSVIRTIGE